jgi:hypothetical protein
MAAKKREKKDCIGVIVSRLKSQQNRNQKGVQYDRDVMVSYGFRGPDGMNRDVIDVAQFDLL